MKFLPFSLRGMASALCLSLAALAGAAPAAFPDKPVRTVVPFAPGGGTDLIARTQGLGVSQALGQTVPVDNRPGAGTVIGTDLVAQSPADGHAVVISTLAHTVKPSLLATLPCDNGTAFAPVGLIGLRAIQQAAHSPEFTNKVEHEGLVLSASAPAGFERCVKAEAARWRKIVKEDGIKAE